MGSWPEAAWRRLLGLLLYRSEEVRNVLALRLLHGSKGCGRRGSEAKEGRDGGGWLLIKTARQKFVLHVARDIRRKMVNEFGKHFLTIRQCIEAANDGVGEYLQGMRDG